MTNLFRKWMDAFQARRRGEARVAPAGVRGRVYQKAGGGSNVLAHVELKPDISARVFRASENAWYRMNPTTGSLEKE